MTQVKVLFFAALKEHAGMKETVVDLPQHARVRDLKAYLLDKHPGMSPAMKSVLVAVNHEFAFDEDLIPEGAEVGLFPPVSGGSGSDVPTIINITDEEIDLDELITRITTPSTGATCIFTGLVREITTREEPRETLYLEYEAYQPMAESKMRQVAEEIRDRWPSVQGIAIVQRVGHLDPGNPNVLIACGAAHRDTGVFDAARYGIDRLKEIVPVWKKEVSSQGSGWVEGKYLPGRND